LPHSILPIFFLDCAVGSSTTSSVISIWALIDHGSDAVLIEPSLADRLGLKRQKLPIPKHIKMVVGTGKRNESFMFDEWVPLSIVSSDQSWTSRTCRAILAPNLCVPVLLGGPFLASNHLVIDHESRTCIDKKSGYDLFNPPVIQYITVKPPLTFGPELKNLQKNVIADIASLFPATCTALDDSAQAHLPCPLAAVRTRIETLISEEVLKRKDALFKEHFSDLFPPDVPNVCDLPNEVLMSIKLRDDLKPMVAHAYSCPRKY